MSRLYTRVACDRCGDMYEILKDEVGDRFVCNRCGLRAQATDSSDFWYEQSLAGWKSAARLNELLKSKEADLENERRAGDAMQESLANLRNENAELQESYKRLYSRKEFLECRFTEFKRQSLMYYKKYVEELGGRIDANKKLKRLEKSRWYVRLRRWARRQWEYDIYA